MPSASARADDADEPAVARGRRGPARARRRGGLAARARSRRERRGSGGARRRPGRRTSRPPRRRRAPPRPRRAGRRAGARASRGAWRAAAGARARTRARSPGTLGERAEALARGELVDEPGEGCGVGSIRLAGTASREVIVAPTLTAARVRSERISGSRAAAPRSRLRPGAPPAKHPQGHSRVPSVDRTETRRTGVSTGPWKRVRRSPHESSRRGDARQLKRRCASSRPSRTSSSTASAARATTPSRSSCASNGEST